MWTGPGKNSRPDKMVEIVLNGTKKWVYEQPFFNFSVCFLVMWVSVIGYQQSENRSIKFRNCMPASRNIRP